MWDYRTARAGRSSGYSWRKVIPVNELKPWQRNEWCIPKVSGEFVARMEDVLDLYQEEHDPDHPVVCFDETSKQLIEDVRPPIKAGPGRVEMRHTLTPGSSGWCWTISTPTNGARSMTPLNRPRLVVL